MSDFIRPLARPRLSRNQLIQIAMAAGASDDTPFTPPPPPGGDGTVIVDTGTNVVQVDTGTNVIQGEI